MVINSHYHELHLEIPPDDKDAYLKVDWRSPDDTSRELTNIFFIAETSTRHLNSLSRVISSMEDKKKEDMILKRRDAFLDVLINEQ
jgi:mannitol/fructose-specific phosphotransferase system IIA component (Ntr-type)